MTDENSTEARKELGAFILGNHAPGGKQSFAPPSASGCDDSPEVRLYSIRESAQGTDLAGASVPASCERQQPAGWADRLRQNADSKVGAVL